MSVKIQDMPLWSAAIGPQSKILAFAAQLYCLYLSVTPMSHCDYNCEDFAASGRSESLERKPLCGAQGRRSSPLIFYKM
jgi:hypothetical protein